MTVGIIGTGRMAKKRARVVAESSDHRVAWVCSRDADRALEFIRDVRAAAGRRSIGEVEARTRLAEALIESPVDAVIDTSPNAFHRTNAEVVFDAGCHLLVEYPHACTPEGGRWIIDAAARAGRSLHVGLTHRFGARHQALTRLFAEGSRQLTGINLGSVVSYSEVICSGNPISRWFDDDTRSGGMFVASLYHYVDQCLSFFGEPTALRGAYAAVRDEYGAILRDTGHALLTLGRPGSSAELAAPAARADVSPNPHQVGAGSVIANIAYSRGFPKPGLGHRRLVVFEGGYVEESADGMIVRSPTGEATLEIPTDDAVGSDTTAFFANVGGRNPTPEWAQTSLEVTCALQEDAGLTAGGRRER